MSKLRAAIAITPPTAPRMLGTRIFDSRTELDSLLLVALWTAMEAIGLTLEFPCNTANQQFPSLLEGGAEQV